MEDLEKTQRRWRTAAKLLAILALIALPLAAVTILSGRHAAMPHIPLADAVAAFNIRSESSPVGQHEPRITEAEIIAAIQAQLPILSASDEVKSLYAEVVRTRSLPYDAQLRFMDGWTLASGDHYTVWWINLDVQAESNAGFGLRIRENNAPSAKPKDEPKLQQPNVEFIPQR
jgi:hypothetical protein